MMYFVKYTQHKNVKNINNVQSRLEELREQRGISAAELARRVNVSRQTIYAIERATFVPNTTVALKLSKALAVTVEEIFAISDETAPEPISADLLPWVSVDVGQPVRICYVNRRLIAAPNTFLPAYLPAGDATVESRRGRSVRIKPVVRLPETGKQLLLAGCDPALSFLRDALLPSGIEIVNVPVGSRLALQWLKQGRVQAAGSHLLDRSTGKYNLPIIRNLLPNASIRVITFALWEQGLVVARGNPKRIRSVADLGRKQVRVMNREKGSGSRDLLDSSLRAFGVAYKNVRGYHSIAPGHLAAAYAVATGEADCCVAPRSAARCFGLDFVPLVIERFDLSLTLASLDSAAGKALLDVLHRSDFRKKLQSIAGYDTSHTGEVLV